MTSISRAGMSLLQGTVPIGQLSNGQPYGVYLMGRHGEDDTVLRAM